MTLTATHAAEHGNEDDAIHLLKLGMYVDIRNKFMQTPAHRAACNKKWKVLKMLLEHGSDIRVYDIDGNTLLHFSAQYSNTAMIEHFLSLGMNMHVKNEQHTPALRAAYYRRCDAVSLLLKHGAGHKAYDTNGKTLLHFAAEHGEEDITIKLLDMGLNVNARDNNMQTPALRAACNRRWEIVILLLQHKAQISASDRNGNTSLHFCCHVWCRKFHNLLIEF